MIYYLFNGEKSVLKNDVGEITTTFQKVSESQVNIEVEMKHEDTSTHATFRKQVVAKEDGRLHHYPIQKFAVRGINAGEHNTVKKYFTHLLGEEGYQEFREQFLKEYTVRQDLELNKLIGKG
ncbi:hypothetical protein [Bacillus thermotolerans]|uniref:hypothetical protein n=1 Tax=Bacillus thermotolerans TaxID=1221996 RepID=UPI00057EC76C|nr:hypothetical protein [Bacillus thermotolerans]KKB37810.1 hypothetical protein QY97_03715 [Bacillus thermotolerans]